MHCSCLMTSIRGVEKKKKKKTQKQELDAKPQRTLSELRNQRDEMCTRDDNISSLLVDFYHEQLFSSSKLFY